MGRAISRREYRKRLKKWRIKQKAIAIMRDDGLCAACYFLLGKKKRWESVHHVYGRGRDEYDPKESYENLLCVCNMHHPLPIRFPWANSKLTWIEDILKQANETPINGMFKECGWDAFATSRD